MRRSFLTLTLTVLLAFILTLTASAQTLVFKDISDHWAKDAIDTLIEKEFITIDDETFRPDQAISRSEFAAMLHKSLGMQIAYLKETDIKEFFDDVDNEAPYAAMLYDLASTGIFNYKDSFKPESHVTREELVHFVINALDYKTDGEYAMILIYPAPFADDDKISEIYKNDIIKAQVLNLVVGNPDGSFRPDAPATRAEAVTVINRFLNVLKNLMVDDVQIITGAEKTEDGYHLSLTITNNTDKPITINHTSGQRFDFQLLDKDEEILYTWSADKMFIMALGETVIEPGESVFYSESLDKEGYEDAVYMVAYITGTSDDFIVDPAGYRSVILGTEASSVNNLQTVNKQ